VGSLEEAKKAATAERIAQLEVTDLMNPVPKEKK
jgi:hypothetical protein